MDGGTIRVISMNILEVLSTLSVGARPAGIDISRGASAASRMRASITSG
jgi:hypothetical protein